ncbi:2OG-Fe(II) oxygenase family protein [Novosphingobium profundi]|uniref:2OG-Fe(II) oxygenase family protein n=1 Tax=Novosphingobium profundi TaxID=1774954 RepID=UPI001CFD1505|nr:putative 2OG-Fe(II) oxygenase [Novosphingobium profundi]
MSTVPTHAAATPDPAREARELKAQGRLDEALEAHLRDVAARPSSAIAEHNLASTLGDLSHFAESAEAARQALRKGSTAPETQLVLARALQGLLQLDEAEHAFRRALELRPDYLDAHQDLAQLRWMRTGDLGHAAAHLDAALTRQSPATSALMILRARLDIAAGEAPAALARLERRLSSHANDPALHLAAAQAAAAADAREVHLTHAVQALRLAPSSQMAAKSAVEALLGLGRAEEGRDLAARILAHHPQDQGVRALLLTAQRLLGDPQGSAPYRDSGLVQQMEVSTPKGWSSRDAWLSALGEALRARHGWTMHPPGQSLRGGSQTQEDLARSPEPVLAGFFASVRETIARYIAELGPGTDPTRARIPEPANTDSPGWRLTGAWSVLLRAGGGHHVDHVHPEGWLSSAFHVETPPATDTGQQGWLAFGRPGCATSPALEPLAHIRPKPGHLVLFPSYLWHGTEPFDGKADRLTVAFDIVPENRA